MHRAQTSTRTAWLKLVVGTALVVRKVGESASDAVGLVGAALISVGAGQIYGPLLPVVAGVFLLTIARNLR